MDKNRKEYLNSLPKKRMGSGALIRNENNEILFVETTYKDYFEIPGGVVEKGESPINCCIREAQEEIGIKLNIKNLLCLEYQQDEFYDSLMYIFDGGILTDSDIKSLILDNSEIKCIKFFNLEDVKEFILPKMFNRLDKALKALKNSTTEYFETLK